MVKKEQSNGTDPIWEEVKECQIALYGLPAQKVENHVVRVGEFGGELLLKLRSSAVLPALEFALAPKYVVELKEQYVAVRKAAETDIEKLAELAKLKNI